MVTKETATDIAMAYRELEVAQKLLDKVKAAMGNDQPQEDIRDAFGRRTGNLQLGIPSGPSSHTLMDVPYSLGVPIIEAYIAHTSARIAALSQKASAEVSATEDQSA